MIFLGGTVAFPGKTMLAHLGFDNFVWIQLASEKDSSTCQVTKVQDFMV